MEGSLEHSYPQIARSPKAKNPPKFREEDIALLTEKMKIWPNKDKLKVELKDNFQIQGMGWT